MSYLAGGGGPFSQCRFGSLVQNLSPGSVFTSFCKLAESKIAFLRSYILSFKTTAVSYLAGGGGRASADSAPWEGKSQGRATARVLGH